MGYVLYRIYKNIKKRVPGIVPTTAVLAIGLVLGYFAYLINNTLAFEKKKQAAFQLKEVQIHNKSALFTFEDYLSALRDNDIFILNYPEEYFNKNPFLQRKDCTECIEAAKKAISRESYDKLMKMNASLVAAEEKFFSEIQEKDTANLNSQIIAYCNGLQEFNDELDDLIIALGGYAALPSILQSNLEP